MEASEWVFTVSKLIFRIYGRLMWFSNPTADPFFWPFIKVIGSVLGVAFVVLLVLEWRHLRELFRGLFTWIWIAPL